MVQAENIDSRCSSFQLDDRSRCDHHSLAHLSKLPLSEAGTPVRTELDTAIMPVTGNRVQLQQVLYNLVSNAIEAMESVADRTMLVKSEHENSGQVRVTIEDSGTGIEPQHIDKISDRATAEIELSLKLSKKLEAADSVPDALAACQEWLNEEMGARAKDARLLMSNGQKFTDATSRFLSSGWTNVGMTT
jgi:light-regulated signal transduction histidine kinase (bacteriophytochrome)